MDLYEKSPRQVIARSLRRRNLVTLRRFYSGLLRCAINDKRRRLVHGMHPTRLVIAFSIKFARRAGLLRRVHWGALKSPPGGGAPTGHCRFKIVECWTSAMRAEPCRSPALRAI